MVKAPKSTRFKLEVGEDVMDKDIGNMKWKQLQEMRRASGIPVTEPTKPAEEPEGKEMKKLAAEPARDAEGKFAKAEEPATPPVVAAEPPAEPVVTKPAYAEIDIAGAKVTVDPSLP